MSPAVPRDFLGSRDGMLGSLHLSYILAGLGFQGVRVGSGGAVEPPPFGYQPRAEVGLGALAGVQAPHVWGGELCALQEGACFRGVQLWPEVGLSRGVRPGQQLYRLPAEQWRGREGGTPRHHHTSG